MAGRDGRVLVVGAGFAGAVYARTLAEAGLDVELIDKRAHIAGNCYDEVHSSGVRFHRYGPHLFHTSNDRVVNWVTRFGSFVPYDHSVSVLLDNGAFVPLPINITTLNVVFNKSIKTEAEAADYVSSIARTNLSDKNAAEYLYSRLGDKLTDIFFRPYTKKMWSLDLEQIEPEVVKRIPIRFSSESRYFPDDTFQALPEKGYVDLFKRILDHALIKVNLSTDFDKTMLTHFDYVFNSMPIDEYYDFRFGHLPYRSIRFHHEVVPEDRYTGPSSVINFSDVSPYTRRTDWSKLPCHRLEKTGFKLLSTEEPCNYTDNNFERYYPVRSTGTAIKEKLDAYRFEAAREASMQFIGRCGTYQYLDMHQVINQSIVGCQRWLAEHNLVS